VTICRPNTCKGYTFSHRWVRKRSEVARLGRNTYFSGCGEWLETIDCG